MSHLLWCSMRGKVGVKVDEFDRIMRAIPSHEDFCSGKIKVLTYILYENGGQNYLWSSEEKDAEITEAVLDDIDKRVGIKIERVAIFKVYKVFDRKGKSENVV